MWTILCVFQPVEGDTRNSEVALASRYNLVRCFSTNMGLCACFSVCLIFMHVGHCILSCSWDNVLYHTSKGKIRSVTGLVGQVSEDYIIFLVIQIALVLVTGNCISYLCEVKWHKSQVYVLHLPVMCSTEYVNFCVENCLKRICLRFWCWALVWSFSSGLTVNAICQSVWLLSWVTDV